MELVSSIHYLHIFNVTLLATCLDLHVYTFQYYCNGNTSTNAQPSANEFSAIFFLLFSPIKLNSPRSFQRFRRTLVHNFISIRQRVKNFPIDPHCKTYVLTLPKRDTFYNWGIWINSLSVVESRRKFRLRVCLKRWNDRRECEFDRAKIKNNIAENSVALGHDTHTTMGFFLWKK